MTRFVDPAPKYRPNSKLFYFASGTNTQIITYKDEFEKIPNTHPVLTDSEGVVPNVFFSVSAKLVVLDENNVQYLERDPVNSQIALGNFTPYDPVVSYDQGEVTKGSDGEFYKSLSNGNTGNDPTDNPGNNEFWEHWPVNGIYNAKIPYGTGEVTQSTIGNLWKSQTTANIDNDPEADDGTNWLPAIDGAKVPEVIALEALNSWDIPKIANFTAVASESRQIDASANTIDITLDTLTAGESFIYHNLITSTFKVQILNPTQTIKGKGGDIAAAVNMELEAGQSVQMVAKSTTVLSIVGALV